MNFDLVISVGYVFAMAMFAWMYYFQFIKNRLVFKMTFNAFAFAPLGIVFAVIYAIFRNIQVDDGDILRISCVPVLLSALMGLLIGGLRGGTAPDETARKKEAFCSLIMTAVYSMAFVTLIDIAWSIWLFALAYFFPALIAKGLCGPGRVSISE